MREIMPGLYVADRRKASLKSIEKAKHAIGASVISATFGPGDQLKIEARTFDGDIDVVAVYDRQLSQQEIKSLYNMMSQRYDGDVEIVATKIKSKDL